METSALSPNNLVTSGVFGICIDCKTDKKILAKGLCNACYCTRRYWNDPEKARAQAKASYHRNIDTKHEYEEKRKHDPKRIEWQVDYVRKPERKSKASDYYHTHKDNPDFRAKTKKHRQSAGTRFSSGKTNAKKRGLEWSLTFQEFKTIVQKPCHYCETSLESQQGCSLDRIDNNLGYSTGNVLPCCGPCNRIRNNYLTVEEMRAAMKAVKELRAQKQADSSESKSHS